LAVEKNRRKGIEVNRKLAAYFLSLQKDENIKSIRYLSHSLKASLGLISQSITEIEENGAVAIERRGQLGSFIKEISIGKLWQIAVGEPLVIAHTLPSNRRYEGLAAAIKGAFHDVGVETYFIFIRGSRTRLKALRDHRCHIAITSLFAAGGLCEPTESVVLSLPSGSFVGAHQLFIRANAPSVGHPLTAAVDPEGQAVEFKKITFMNIFHYLSTNQVDMAIWTEDDMQSHLGNNIKKQSLSPHTQEAAGTTDTQAALITRSDDAVVGAVIKKVLLPSQLMTVQQAIIDGMVIPEY